VHYFTRKRFSAEHNNPDSTGAHIRICGISQSRSLPIALLVLIMLVLLFDPKAFCVYFGPGYLP
jgi:hypothetical protein